MPLDEPLRQLNHLQDVLDGHIAPSSLEEQLEQRQPVGVRISWPDQPGAGHVLVISGYDQYTGTAMLEDPKYGRKQHYSYELLIDQYITNGYWSFTYLTQKNSVNSSDPN